VDVASGSSFFFFPFPCFNHISIVIRISVGVEKRCSAGKAAPPSLLFPPPHLPPFPPPLCGDVGVVSSGRSGPPRWRDRFFRPIYGTSIQAWRSTAEGNTGRHGGVFPPPFPPFFPPLPSALALVAPRPTARKRGLPSEDFFFFFFFSFPGASPPPPEK